MLCLKEYHECAQRSLNGDPECLESAVTGPLLDFLLPEPRSLILMASESTATTWRRV